MLIRTRQVRSSAELRAMFGVRRLVGDLVACLDGEWRREGSRWRFWRRRAEARSDKSPQSEPPPEPWWDR